MAYFFSLPTIRLLLLLALVLGLANSSRILDDVTPQSSYSLSPPSSVVGPINVLPSAHAPAMNTDADTTTDQPDQPQPNPNATKYIPSAQAPALGTDTPVDQPDQPQPNPDDTYSPLTAPGPYPVPASPQPIGQTTTFGEPNQPTISFYMHDVLGGSQAFGRVVTGLVSTENVDGNPLSRPNNQVFPVANGVLLPNNNLFNNNNFPYVAALAGLTGQNQQSSQTASTAATNNNNQAFVTPGQLPSGLSLQNLMFEPITVIDDELTDGPELGSNVVGRGQGLYLASSLDSESHTMAFTALLSDSDQSNAGEDSTLTFFGVHQTASPVSRISIVGGTGKYENAKGYATIEALPQQDQYTTDGIDTIAHISVFIY
ncbi:hypothetical protein vseg_002832 [Gypsophila vaccaria]